MIISHFQSVLQQFSTVGNNMNLWFVNLLVFDEISVSHNIKKSLLMSHSFNNKSYYCTIPPLP
jgi:hypothetical protein